MFDFYFDYNVNIDVLSALASAIIRQHELVPNLIEAAGHVTDCVVKASFQLPSDLIAMGIHRASEYRNGFAGTNGYNTIKYCNCLVLAIPHLCKTAAFHKILFPIRPVSGALANHGYVDTFFSENTTVDVLGFSHKGEGETAVLEKLVEEGRYHENWLRVSTNSFWGSLSQIPEPIFKHAQNSKTDLMVLTSLLDLVIKPGYIGPHAQKIIHYAGVPVPSIKKTGVSSLTSFTKCAAMVDVGYFFIGINAVTLFRCR